MASPALVDKAGMEDQGRLQRMSPSRECRAVLEKEAGRFQRKKYQESQGEGKGEVLVGFRIRAARCETRFSGKQKWEGHGRGHRQGSLRK